MSASEKQTMIILQKRQSELKLLSAPDLYVKFGCKSIYTKKTEITKAACHFLLESPHYTTELEVSDAWTGTRGSVNVKMIIREARIRRCLRPSLHVQTNLVFTAG